MKFMYSSGQRPLDGYTIKRGIGRGGFGEVYFALSDGGKEVALKLVRGDDDIELRGVAGCLNLKHPNLVNIYDLKKDDHGNHWVVMEYVAGETLGTILRRHPRGLPRELAREWFLGMARAVGYLHEHGIVHRDLKPGNIFVENGQVKVGDYGLSKSMSHIDGKPQTQSVGTVHYMAPEISTGNYNKQIDTYAAGIMLFEMLTGDVPFDGESAGEILMKHLTTPPDLSKVSREFVPILSRALAKNPAQRYATMAEMARAVEALGHDGARETHKAVPVVLPAKAAKDEPVMTALPAVTLRTQLQELCTSLPLAVLFAALGTAVWAAITQGFGTWDLASLGMIFFMTVGTTWAVLVPGKFWSERKGDAWTRRLILMVMGAFLGLGAMWLNGLSFATPPAAAGENATFVSTHLHVPQEFSNELAYVAYYAVALFAVRWWKMTDRKRPHRFSVGPVFVAAIWSLLLLLLSPPAHLVGALVLIMTSVIVQVVSPWDPPPQVAKRGYRQRLAHA